VNPEDADSQSGEEAQPPRLLVGLPSGRTPSHAAQPLDIRVLAGVPTARAPLAAPAVGALPITETDQLQPPLVPQKIAAPSRLRRIVFTPVKLIWGMVFCQSVLGALAVLGWTYRVMQRSALQQWWKLSESPAKLDSFVEFVASDSRTCEHIHSPNWFLIQC